MPPHLYTRLICLFLFASLLLMACTNQEQAVSPTVVSTDDPTTIPSDTQITTVPATDVPVATAVPVTEVPDVSEPAPDIATPVPEVTLPGDTTPASERSLALQEPRLEGDDVRAAQQQLEALGYAVGEIDGVYGPQTEAATRAFQVRNNLTVDGIVGPQTWGQLFSDTALAAGEADVVPIVDARTGWLLGGSSGDKWLDGSSTAALLEGNEEYRLYTLTEQQGIAVGSKPEAFDIIPCPATFAVDFTLVPRESSILALGGDWDALPRVPIEEGTDSEVYEQVVAEWLQDQGIAAPEVHIKQVIRVDLEGDGTDEVLISATRFAASEDGLPPRSIETGDYSLTMLRKIVDGEVANIFVAGESYTETQDYGAPNEYRVGAILDTNGDGQMEFTIESQYFEGAATGLYRINGKQLESLLITGCGL